MKDFTLLMKNTNLESAVWNDIEREAIEPHRLNADGMNEEQVRRASRSNPHCAGIELLKARLTDGQSQRQYSIKTTTMRVWKYAAMIFLVLCLGVGQMWGVDYCASSAFGYGAGATGGGSATPVLVSSVDQLKSALNGASNKVIIITSNLTFTSMLTVKDGSNITLLGLPGVVLTSNQQDDTNSGILYFRRYNNLIIRNLTFVGPGAYDCDGNDLLCFDDVTNAWVDHCDFQDGVDGNFDNKHTTDNVTVSWCRFRYLKSPRAGGSGGSDDHRFTNLLGASSSDKPSDNIYNLTWAYCWWDNGCKERMVRCRNAELHFLNCYWNSSVANYYVGPENAKCYFEGCTFAGAANSSSKIFKSYGGTNACKFVNCTGNSPSNSGTVSNPAYAYSPYANAAAAVTAVTNSTCGAGATLTVTRAGVVSSTCDGAVAPTIYTVTWNATTNGGSCGTSSTLVESGQAIGTLPTATKDGYTFDGWFTASSGGTQINASTTVSGNITYYAQFTASGGGGGGGCSSGTLYSAVVAATSEQSFSASSTTELTASQAAVTGGTIYAINQQTDSKNLIDDQSSKWYFTETNNNTFFKIVLNCSLQTGDVITIDAIGGTKDGHPKGLWVSTESSRPSSSPACAGTSSTSSLIDDMVNYTVTGSDEYVGKSILYIYRAVGSSTYFNNINITRPGVVPTYTLSYDENGGSGSAMADQVGTTLTVATNTYTAPTGYSFLKWNTAMNGGGTDYSAGGSITLTEDVTLYAIWQPQTYTVTLNQGSGSGGTANVTATFDDAMPSITVPSRSGYTFAGYFTAANGEGTQYYDENGSSTNDWTIANNTTLYAYWIEGSAPAPSGCDLHFHFFYAADATSNGVTNDATVFTSMVSSGSEMAGSITIDGTSYSVTRRTGDNATFGTFTIPSGKTGTFYALAVSSGAGDRQINLVCGGTTYELPVEGGSGSYKRLEQGDLPAGTYSIQREGSSNVRLGVVVVKLCEDVSCASAYSFHYGPHTGDWETPICFEQVGVTHEWQITDFVIPSHASGEFYVGYEGSTNSQSVTRAWTYGYSDGNGAMKLLPTSSSIVGQATGAKGTISIWDDSGWQNQNVGFTPDGYGITYGGVGHAFNTTATANMLETDVVTLPDVSTTYTMGLATSSAGTYVTCAHSSAAEAISNMGVTILDGGKKKILLSPGSFNADEAVYAVWDGTNSAWGDGTTKLFTDADGDGVWECPVASSCTSINLVRMSSGTTASNIDWSRKWNQTANISVGDLLNKYTITSLSDNNCAYTTTAIHPATGDKGKFRMWANSADNNWYVHWIPYYVLSYDGNGGTGTTAQTERNSESGTLTVNTAANGFTAPTGYQFAGWANSDARADAGTVDYAAGASYTLTSNATLYAVWQAKSCTITLNNQSATNAGTASVTATYNASTNLLVPISCPFKTGYYFDGYYTETGGNGTQLIDRNGNFIASVSGYTDASRNWIHDGDVTLYAKWTALTVTLTLSPTTIAPSTATNVTYTITTNAPTNTTVPYYYAIYTFGNPDPAGGYIDGDHAVSGGLSQTISVTKAAGSWYTQAVIIWGGSVVQTSAKVELVAGTLYTVTYNANGGSVEPSSVTQASEGASVTLATPTRSGYTFQNWVIGGATYAAGASYTPTADITAYATWKENCAGGGGSTTLISITPTITNDNKNNGSASASGTPGGTAYWDKMGTSSPYKLNNDEAYFALKLSSGYYQATDVLVINGADKAHYVYYGSHGSGTALSATGAPSSGTINFTLTGLPSSVDEIYVYRSSDSYNGKLSSMSVTRTGSTCYYVTYDGNGADGGFTNDPEAYSANDDPEVLANGFTKTDYEFTGWYTKAVNDGTGTAYSPGDNITDINANVTLYAQWAVPCTAAPTVSAGSNSSVASTTATVSCTGGITSLGTSGCTITSYGFVLGTSANPTTSNTTYEVGTTYTSTGVSFSKDLTGLTASTTYYVRPYATNGYGTGYGTQTSFTTAAPPTYTLTVSGASVANPMTAESKTGTISGVTITGSPVSGIASGTTTSTSNNTFTVNKGTPATVTASATVSGSYAECDECTYVFDHWTNVPASVIADVSNIQAVYNTTYTIAFRETDGTTIASASDTYYVYGTGKTVATFPTPTKSGYEFSGWYKETSLTNAATDLSSSDYGNITYYAKWIEIATLACGTLYKVEDMVPASITLSGTGQYAEGISSNGIFTTIGDPSKTDGAAGTPEMKNESSTTIAGESFTGRMYFKGASNTTGSGTTFVPTSRAIKFVIAKNGTLDIYAHRVDRLYLKKAGDSGTTQLGSSSSTTPSKVSHSVTAGTYYIYSVDGSDCVYGMQLNCAYTVTYKANGSGESDEVDDDAKTIAANPFTWSGHTFVGWNTADDGSGTPYAVGATVSADLTLYAQWKSNATVYSFSNGSFTDWGTCNGGTLTLVNSQTGVSYQLYKDGVASGDPKAGTTGSAINWTVTASGTYTVKSVENATYAETAMTGSAVVTLNDPTLSGESSVDVGSTITLTHPGYLISGGSWTSSNGSVATVVDGVVTGVAAGTATITFHGVGSCDGSKEITIVATYSITYDCDGAESGCPSNVAAATNLPSPLPSAPTKDGYDFVGWYTNSTKTVAAVAGAALSENTTLYAKWTVQVVPCFKMVANSSAGSEQTLSSGESITQGSKNCSTLNGGTAVYRNGVSGTMKVQKPSPYGWYFGSSSDSIVITLIGSKLQVGSVITISGNAGSSGCGITINANTSITKAGSSGDFSDSYTVVAGDSHLVDKYVLVLKRATGSSTRLYSISIAECGELSGTFDITYHLNGASWVNVGEDSYTYGTGYTLPVAGDMTNPGYTFGGWYANSDLSTGGVQTIISSSDAGDKEYWAKWTENLYDVTYNANGGTGDAMSATHGHYVTISDNTYTAPSGKTFVEWNTAADGSGTHYYEGEEVELTANLSLYAIWATDYTITWGNVQIGGAGATVTPNLGGGNYTITASVATWTGSLTTDMISAVTSGLTITNVTVNNGVSPKTITVTFNVGADVLSNAITFLLSLPSDGTYAAKDSEHEISIERCSVATEVRFTSSNKNDAGDNFAELSNNSSQLIGGGLAKMFAVGGDCGLSTNVNKAGYRLDRANIVFKLQATSTLDIYYNAGSTSRSFALYSFSSGKALSAIETSDYSSKTIVKTVTAAGASFASTAAGGASVSNGVVSVSGSSGGIKATYSSLSAGYYVLMHSNGEGYVYGFDVASIGGIGGVTPTLTWETDLSSGESKRTSDDGFIHTASQDQNSLGAITYSSSNTAVATVNATTGEVHMAGSAGNATITATIAASGCYNQASVSYILSVEDDCDDVAGTIGTLNQGCDGILMSVTGHTTTASTSYQWYKDGSPIGGATSDNYTATAAGSYYVEVSNTGDRHCTKRSTNTVVIAAAESATASKIVDSWYVKNGRRTPDIALVKTENASGFYVKIGSDKIWDSDGSVTTGFGGCSFHLGNDSIIYLNGMKDNGDATSGLDAGDVTLKITAVGCSGNSSELSITIHKQAATSYKSVAFVVDGTKDGAWNAVTSGHADGTPLYEYLDTVGTAASARKFALTECNIYKTTDEKSIREHYSQFDAIVITDDPNTGTKDDNKKSYVNAFGTMIDIRPILSMEAYVSKLKNWGSKGVAGKPSSPNPRQYEMRLQCKDHEIYSGLPAPAAGTHVWSEIIDGEEYRHVIMVDSTKSPYAGVAYNEQTAGEEKPALQGFASEDMGHLLGLGLILNGTLHAGVERQEEPAARMMILGIQSKALPNALTDEGKKVIENAVTYLLKTNMEEVDDCSNFFKGGDSSKPRDWQTVANWYKGTLPTYETKVRILAPCELSGAKVRVAQVDIVSGGTSSKMPGGTCSGSLTIASDAALIVTGKVRSAEAPHFASNDLKPTELGDLTIKADETNGNGTLIFDNKDGNTQAVVEMYSKAQNSVGSWSWQYVAVPFNDNSSAYRNYYGSWLYRWAEDNSGWEVVPNRGAVYPWIGYCLTQETAKQYVMDGTLVETTEQEFTVGSNQDMVIGNSWTAPIQVKQFTDDDFGGLTKNIYLFNTGLDVDCTGSTSGGRYESGTYVVVPIHSAEYTGDSLISSLQAFTINNSSGSDATLTLDYDRHVRPTRSTDKVNAGPMHAPKRMAEESDKPVVLKILVSGDRYDDRLVLLEREDFSRGYDAGWDGEKILIGGNSQEIFSVMESGQESVTATPDMDGTVIGFRAGEDDIYTFHFEYDGYDEPLYLLDTDTKIFTRVVTGNIYTFMCTDKRESNRFLLTRKNAQDAPTDNANIRDEYSKPLKFLNNDKIYIYVRGVLYDITGKVVK